MLGYDDSNYTLEIHDASDASEGVTVNFACLDPATCPPDGILRLRIDGSKGTYKLISGSYTFTSGSVTIEVATGHAVIEFVVDDQLILVEVGDGATALIEEIIVDDELVTPVVTNVGDTGVVTTQVGEAEPDVLEPGQSRMPVTIDIKPDDPDNTVNLDGHGVIPVAILGSSALDVTLIDAGSVELEGMAVRAVGKSNKLLAQVDDVNLDGHPDLIVQIEDSDGSFAEGVTTATLRGALLPEAGWLPHRGGATFCESSPDPGRFATGQTRQGPNPASPVPGGRLIPFRAESHRLEHR